MVMNIAILHFEGEMQLLKGGSKSDERLLRCENARTESYEIEKRSNSDSVNLADEKETRCRSPQSTIHPSILL